jgi:flagellar biosynthesis protein
MAAPGPKRPDEGDESRHKKAVALQYDRRNMSAPKLTAKGEGLLAERLIELAREHGVPVREDRLLVEALEGLKVGQDVPAELYQVVAEILVAVYRAERQKT